MVKAYAVNWSEAWPIPDDEPKDGHYVKYEDYAALKAFTDELVRLRRGGTLGLSAQFYLDKAVQEYEYD